MIAPDLVPLCAGDHNGWARGNWRTCPAHVHVPFLSSCAWCLIGLTARSLATHVGPPRARNVTLAVALSGSICPSSTPATARRSSSGQARAAHLRVECRRPGRRRQRRWRSARGVSRIVLNIRRYQPGRYKCRRQTSHATPRCEARRFNVGPIVVPGNPQHTRGQVVYRKAPLFW